jgi:hypothetical protein
MTREKTFYDFYFKMYPSRFVIFVFTVFIKLCFASFEEEDFLFLRNLTSSGVTPVYSARVHEQSSPAWFGVTSYSDGVCSGDSYLQSSGLLAGQCLYSHKYDVHFYISCGRSKH